MNRNKDGSKWSTVLGMNRDGESVPAQDHQDFDEVIGGVGCKLDCRRSAEGN